jgi:heme-degrading monooxygenase HmoA
MNDVNNYSVEIIRYNIPAMEHSAFEEAYKMAFKLLEASPYCKSYQLIKGADEPDNYIITINWTSIEDHLQKFRKSEQFGSFFHFVKPFFNNITEMKHYQPPLASWTKDVSY